MTSSGPRKTRSSMNCGAVCISNSAGRFPKAVSKSPRLNASFPASYACLKSSSVASAMGAGVSLTLPAQRGSVDRLGEQHLLGEDQVRAVVVGHLVVVAHRDRVERARHLAVAAEDAAAEVDLVDLGVALAGRDPVVRVVLMRDDPDAVGRTGRGAERAADALLEARVIEAVQLVAAAEPRVDRRLLLRVLDRHGPLGDAAAGGAQAAEGLAEGAVGGGRARCGPAPRGRGHGLVAVQVGEGGPVRLLLVELRLHPDTVTITAVTSTFSVASGSMIFQPSDMSWS